MTYFHRSNFRQFTVNPITAAAKKEPRISVAIEVEFPIQTELLEVGDDKNEQLAD